MDMSKNMERKLDLSAELYQRIMRELSVIDGFKGSWGSIEGRESMPLRELRKIATIESTGSSTRIEGATLTDNEVDELLRSMKVERLSTREQQEVAGYYEALELVLEHYEEIELSERYIHQLHSVLLKYSEKDQGHRGRYKTLSNQVVANYPDGEQRTIFRTTDPALTEKEMGDLVTWTNERLREGDMHPVMLTATFAYEFLSVHPYQDGNGRLSRLLTTLLLMKQGYGFVQYVSFEHVIEARKEDYYQALMAGQKDRYQEDERIGEWLLFFLECMVTLIERLKAKYETYSKLGRDLNERQQRVLGFVREMKKVRIGEVEEAFPDYSRNTLKKDLAALVREGLLIRTGERKGARYHFPEDGPAI